MLRFAFSFLLLCVLSGFVPNGLLAHEYKTGDYIVILSNTHLEAEKPEEPHGEAVWLGRVLSVRKQVGNRLQLNGDKPGWLESQHVMPCDEAAVARLTEWIAAEPKNAKLYCGRGNVYAVQENRKQAVADFTEAIRLSPEASLYAMRAKIYLGNDQEKAVADIKHAIELDPNNTNALANGITVYQATKDFTAAKECYNRLLAKDPMNADGLLGRAIDLFLQRQYSEAIEVLHQVPAENYQGIHLKAYCHFKLDQYDKSISFCNIVLQQDPNNTEYLLLRGTCSFNKNDIAHAKGDLKRAIQLGLSAANERGANELLEHLDAREMVGPYVWVLIQKAKEISAKAVDETEQVEP